MSTLKEKLKEIYQGWSNLVFDNPEIEKEAKRRAEICAGCMSNQKGICNACGCLLAAKTRSPQSNCPLKKW